MKISAKKYARALAEALLSKDESEADEIISNFILLLKKHRRTKLLKNFLPIFSNVWTEKNNQINVILTSVKACDEKEKESLKEVLSKILNKSVLLHEVVDSNVIGGLKIEFSDYVLDGTLKRNLEVLKSKLSNN